MLTAYPGPQKRKSNLLNKKVMVDTDMRKKEVKEVVVVVKKDEEEKEKEVHFDHLQ